MASDALTGAEVNAIPQELRHYTCQQCGMGHPNASLFRMVEVFGVLGFVVCRACLSGKEQS